MIHRIIALAAVALGLLLPCAAAESFTDPEGDATPSSTDITEVATTILTDRMHLNLTLAGPVDSTGVYTHCDIKLNPEKSDEAHYGVALVFGVFGGNRYVDGQPRNINTSASSWSGNTIRFVAERNETFTKDTLFVDCRTEKSTVRDIATRTFPEPSSVDPAPNESDGPTSADPSDPTAAPDETFRTVDIGGSAPAIPFTTGICAVAVITVLGRKRQ